eukprot:scaffold502_cov350-Pavlova_lutheri.AAC.23
MSFQVTDWDTARTPSFLVLSQALARILRTDSSSPVPALRRCVGRVGWRGGPFRGGRRRLLGSRSFVRIDGRLPVRRPGSSLSNRLGIHPFPCIDLPDHLPLLLPRPSFGRVRFVLAPALDPSPALRWVSTFPSLFRPSLASLVPVASAPPSRHPRSLGCLVFLPSSSGVACWMLEKEEHGFGRGRGGEDGSTHPTRPWWKRRGEGEEWRGEEGERERRERGRGLEWRG